MIYLVGCAEMFRSPNEKTHLFQITFSKGNVGYDYPMSRKHLYQSPDAGGSQAGA
jgi:cyclopropane-fatty-acyl-phospholipid synthase